MQVINAQIKRGDLLYVDVAKGYGTGLLVSRASYEAEKSILRHILEGKEAVTPTVRSHRMSAHDSSQSNSCTAQL